MKPFRLFFTCLLFCLTAGACFGQSPEQQRTAAGDSSYWTLVGQFVDKTAHMAYAQRMKELHGADFTDKQQLEYSVLTEQYSAYLNRLRKNNLVNREHFWPDAKDYAERMILGAGVPIPGRPTATYSLHTGSAGEDRELYAKVTGQIDVARGTIADPDLLARSGRQKRVSRF